MSDLRPIEPTARFSVVLAVWPPTGAGDRRPGLVSPALRHEAIVAAARAVFALGGRLVTVGDTDVAPVLAAVALDYSPVHAMESAHRPPSPLTVIESDGRDETLRALLAPYVHRQVLQYLDAEGEGLELDGEPQRTAELGEYRRHPLRSWILERFAPRGAIFIAPHGQAEEEIEMLAAKGVDVAVLADTAPYVGDAERWRDRDPMRELIGDVPLDRWTEQGGLRRDGEGAHELWLEHPDEPRSRAGVPMPYAFVLQRLIGGWAG
jgi:hypothetical protein